MFSGFFQFDIIILMVVARTPKNNGFGGGT
jgi:hypothetical protein